MTVKAIYQNGVFRPVKPVDLPELAEVEVVLPADTTRPVLSAAMNKIYDILSRSYETDQPDLAERHNEHQP
ncbi:MAG TPA: antitoxin family protein [Tepidisphaeraceae bacterium]|nr:antitoxin family protein [Tepidisphaeraceae bacterium]